MKIFLSALIILSSLSIQAMTSKQKNKIKNTFLKDPYVHQITLPKNIKIKQEREVRHYQTPQLAEICLLEAQDLTEQKVVIDLPENISRFNRFWAMPGVLNEKTGLYVMKFDLSFVPIEEIKPGIFGIGLTDLKNVAKETFEVKDLGQSLSIKHHPYHYKKFQEPNVLVIVNDRWAFSRQYLLSLYSLIEWQVEKLKSIDHIKKGKDLAFWRDMVHRHIAFCTSPKLGVLETDPVVQAIYRPLRDLFRGDNVLKNPAKLKAFLASKKKILAARSNSIQRLRQSLQKKRDTWKAYKEQVRAYEAL